MARPAATPLILSLCLTFAATAWVGPAALALETDQFTAPDKPLADIGPELNHYVTGTLWNVVQEANAKAAAHDREAGRAAWDLVRQYHRGKAAQFRGEDYLNRRLYEALAGTGVPECKIELWVKRRRFRAGGPVSFGTTRARCVYGDSVFTKPLLLVDLSPTVNVHGSYIGLDKLGHLFQQGYDYFREYRHEELRGGGGRRALARAVRLGIRQERGIFGEALVGVYSNADLAANYAGLKFYLNVTRPVSLDGETLPPVLVRGGDGLWVLNPARGNDDVLRPFVSDHFNEAHNPSRFSDQMRATVRSNVRRRAERLVAFYGLSPERARARQAELSTWHGEGYGHCGFDRVVTVADNCFRGVPRQGPPTAPHQEARTAAARLSTR